MTWCPAYTVSPAIFLARSKLLGVVGCWAPADVARQTMAARAILFIEMRDLLERIVGMLLHGVMLLLSLIGASVSVVPKPSALLTRKAAGPVRRSRDLRLLRTRARWTVAPIATHLCYSKRHVYRVLADSDERQPS